MSDCDVLVIGAGHNALILFWMPYPDGSHFAVWKEVDKTCASIAQISPQDADNYRAFMARWGKLAQGMVNSFLEPPTGQNLFRNLVRRTSANADWNG